MELSPQNSRGQRGDMKQICYCRIH